MYSSVREFISKVLSSWSKEVPALLESIAASASSTHATSSSLCGQLRVSWEILLEKLSLPQNWKALRPVVGDSTAHGKTGNDNSQDSTSTLAGEDQEPETSTADEKLETCECGSSDCKCQLSLALAQVSLDYSWEQLHSGHWKDVRLCWRQAYALAALAKALNLYLLGKGQEALVELDKGILLGAPVLDSSLHVVAALVNRELMGGVGVPTADRIREDNSDDAPQV